MSPFAASRHDAGLERGAAALERGAAAAAAVRINAAAVTAATFGKHIATQHMTRTHELHA